MDQLAVALQQAGMQTADVQFIAACGDLGRLALNRQPDPERAATAWIAMAADVRFRAALVMFLTAIKAGMKKSEAGETHCRSGDQLVSGPPASDPEIPDREEAHRRAGNQRWRGPSRSGTETDGDAAHSRIGGKIAQEGCGPSPSAQRRLQAVHRARLTTARVLSGFYITERQGGRTAFEDISVGRVDSLLRHLSQRAGTSAVEWLAVRLAEKRFAGVYTPEMTFGQIFSTADIAAIIAEARAMAQRTIEAVQVFGPAAYLEATP